MIATPYRIIITAKVAAEIEAAHAYIANDSKQNAREFTVRLFKAIDSISSFFHAAATSIDRIATLRWLFGLCLSRPTLFTSVSSKAITSFES